MFKAKRRLYLAYGSNLNLEQMAKRCPTATVVDVTVMNNWRLCFNGVATIERCKGYRVPVVVWNLRPADEASLDRYEGWPHLYRKESVRVNVHGKRARAMVYIMNGGNENPPNLSYYETIRQAITIPVMMYHNPYYSTCLMTDEFMAKLYNEGFIDMSGPGKGLSACSDTLNICLCLTMHTHVTVPEFNASATMIGLDVTRTVVRPPWSSTAPFWFSTLMVDAGVVTVALPERFQ